jgi:sec-independent protein translocase protein TatA
MPKLGPLELVLILVVVLVIFGAGKLPSIGGAIGKSIHEFRRESKGGEEAKVASSSKEDVAVQQPSKS